MVGLCGNVAVASVGVAKRRNDEVVRAVVGNGGRQACNVVSVSSRGDEGTVQACGGLASVTELFSFSPPSFWYPSAVVPFVTT